MAADQDPKMTAIRQPYTKAKLFAAISDETGLSKKEVAAVFESLERHMFRHLKKRSAGQFTLPGLAKFVVQTRKATKQREGVNPFTGEPMTFAAKPARRVIKVRTLKGLKEMADS